MAFLSGTKVAPPHRWYKQLLRWLLLLLLLLLPHQLLANQNEYCAVVRLPLDVFVCKRAAFDQLTSDVKRRSQHELACKEVHAGTTSLMSRLSFPLPLQAL